MPTEPSSFKPSVEQRRIIEYPGKHLQVIACAGSGKTEAISRRVSKLILDGVKPHEIVAFTFTERAAASLKSRILLRVTEMLGSEAVHGIGPMYIGTIHSYCYRLLQEHVPEFANFDVLDDHRHAALLSREFKRLNLDRVATHGHWRSIGTFIRNAEVVENELIDLSKFAKTEFGRVYQEYTAMLHRYRFLTYGRLISTAVSALKEGSVFESVHEPLKYLFVDEYQDINPAQEELIRFLARPPVCLQVVGDDDQAIYQWRGSDVTNIQRFVKRYESAKTLPLSTNRRSRPRIIAVANKFAKSIKPRLDKKMEQRREPGGPECYCWSAETAEEEAGLIVDAIQELHRRGYRYRDVGILLRSVRTSSGPILSALREADIPVECAGRTGLFQQPEANLLGKTYAWLANHQWCSKGWDNGESTSCTKLLKEYTNLFKLSPKQALATKVRLKEWKSAAESKDDPANLVRDYYLFLRTLRVHRWDPEDPVVAAKLGLLARFSQLLADFEHTRRRARWIEVNGEPIYKGGQSRGPWYYQSLFNYLQYYARDAYEDFEGEKSFDTDAVDVLTVHQAKGLEWPVVFLPALVKGRFPSSMTGRPGDWLLSESLFGPKARRRYEGEEADERRLFYVAMTRARDMLYLSSFRRITNRKSPSPFLLEVAGNQPEPATGLPLPLPYEGIDNGDQEALALSFSDIAGYEKCPLSYRLSSLLGFQPQLAAELGYGKAVHHILRRLADYVQEQGRLPNHADLEEIMRTDFYLPYANQVAFDKLNNTAMKLINQYLNGHSNELSRVWETERPFELHLEGGSLTGRADVILDRENGTPGSMAIVDYKTSTDSDYTAYKFQLAIYAAAGRAEGMDVRAAYIHNLHDGKPLQVPVDVKNTDHARHRAQQGLKGISNREFLPRKGEHCTRCDVRFVCRHGSGR